MRIECSYRNYSPAPNLSQFIEKEFQHLEKYNLVNLDTLVIVSINYHEKASRYKLKAFVKNLKSTNSIFSEIKSHDLHKAIVKLRTRVEGQIKVIKELKNQHNK